jgi:arsenate reductase-like glutaredoxin family protein
MEINTQMTLLIHSDKDDDQKAIQYMNAIPGLKIMVIDLAIQSVSESELTALAGKLSLPIEDMLDSDYDDHISVHTEGLRLMDRQSLLTLMTEDTKLIATPIVVIGDEAFIPGRERAAGHEQIAFEIANRAFGVTRPE